jgi:hypothetical protein
MFENATDMIQQHLRVGEYRGLTAGLIALFIAWVVFIVIREFWCWFWKTTAIANELETINSNLRGLQAIGVKFQVELSKANSKLERIAESASAAAGNKQAGSGGN